MNSHLSWLQILSSASLTIMGLTVSIFAAAFNFRNNFGWPPLVLITGHGFMSGGGVGGNYRAFVKIGFWNLRKYPIIVRCVNVRIDGLDLVREINSDLGGCYLNRGSLVLYDARTVAPQTHEDYNVSAPFAPRSLDGLTCPVVVDVSVFDPRVNKTEIVTTRGLYSLGTSPEPASSRAGWIDSLSS